MGLIFNLSLRNLLRQKRRNLMLGIGIGFGMMILVIASSFSHGMMDVLINDIVSYTFGHMVVEGRPGNVNYQVIRDKERFVKIIIDTIKKEDLVYITDNMGIAGRAIGNGEADIIMIVGVADAQANQDFLKNFFSLVDGNFNDFFSPNIEYPVIISTEEARVLNVKLHDIIHIKLPMVTGQIQAADLTVVAIANANNSGMNNIAFMEGVRAKKLLGYKPWESSSLQIRLKNPKQTAPYYAALLYPKLQPELLSIIGSVNDKKCTLAAFKNNDIAKRQLLNQLKIIRGDQEKALAKDGVMVSKQLAGKLHLQVGDEFSFHYSTKFRGPYEQKLKLRAIYQTDSKLNNLLLVNEEKIHDTFNRYLPAASNGNYLAKTDPLYPVMATEWKLLPRAKDSESLMKIYKDARKIKTNQENIDVVTMYEGASDILNLEGVLNSITYIAVLVLFFIILIGVINTLRMTIGERTREIGTVRAIGMQKMDVRNEFILETLLLTIFSCTAGTILGITVMLILGSIPFHVNNALSMILKDKHLFFKIDPMAIFLYFILILVITAVTAFFPAKRAANLSAVEALRHYE